MRRNKTALHAPRQALEHLARQIDWRFSLGMEQCQPSSRAMRTESYNPGVSLRVPDATCEHLCRAVSSISGVVITQRRRPFWTLSDGSAELTLRGCTFTIEPDDWDGVYWVMSRDLQQHEAEMSEIQSAVEGFTLPRGRISAWARRMFAGGHPN